MTKFSQKYTIVHLFDPLPDVYEFSMQYWPLHVALAEVFAVEDDMSVVISDLASHLKSIKPVSTSVIGEDWFGPDKDVHVMLLEKTYEMQRIHANVLSVLRKHGVTFNTPEYVDEGYRPHSTIQGENKLELGQQVTVNSLAVIDMFPDEDATKRRILVTLEL